MNNIIIKPCSEEINGKWIPTGVIAFQDLPQTTEHSEQYDNIEFDTKEKADQYFLEASKEKYRK